MNRLLYILCTGIVLMSIGGSSPAQTIRVYVSTTGSENGDGTSENPYNTLRQARDHLRVVRSGSPIRDTAFVIVAGGTYALTEPFLLEPQDGGKPGTPVIYMAARGATPIFDGGHKINGFKVLENGWWQVDVPQVDYWGWTFEQLYVNGRRADRARSPNTGYYRMGSVAENIWKRGVGRAPERAEQVVGIDPDLAHNLSMVPEDAFSRIQMTVFHKWDMTRRTLDALDADSNTIITSGQGMKPWNQWVPGQRFILEQYAAALDTLGEWFLSQNGRLTYIPLPGETPENSMVMAPVLEKFIIIRGDLDHNNPVEHLYFKGLRFQHAAYRMPPEGFEPNQAAANIDAVIQVDGARSVHFEDCEVFHTGRYGVWFRQGCSHCSVSHCYLRDLGAGGIRIGETVIREDEMAQTHHIRIHNNIIQGGGYIFPPAVGIWIGHSGYNEVTHNDIGDLRYTGISVGWRWGYEFSPARDNKVMFNHIHHIGWGILSDMAGVYTLGPSEGTEVSCNHVHHVYAYSYGGWGLYTDEGSSRITMENNLVHDTKTGGFHQHYGRENIIRNNIFAFGKLYQLQCTRVEDHLSFIFTNNIVLFSEGMLFQGPWTAINAELKNNCYWKWPAGSEITFLDTNFSAWKDLGLDQGSIIEDPAFADPGLRDFSFTRSSAYKKINFEPFEAAAYGIYGDSEWIRKAELHPDLVKRFQELME